MPWDVWAGLRKGHLTAHTRRLVALAGSTWSFDLSSQRLKEFCGLRVSAQTIRRVTDQAGREAAAWSRRASAATEDFRHAQGQTEFFTDGTMVNTVEGWREMRLGAFAKRNPGSSAAPAEWRTRKLPRPTSRVAFGGIIDSKRFGRQWKRRAERVGIAKGKGLSVLGDGARWIWNQVAAQFPQSTCVVDVYHVSEHMHTCGRALFGEGTAEAQTWADTQTDLLVAEGPMQLLHVLEVERRQTRSPKKREAIDALVKYVRPRVDGLWYRDRLQAGLPIGSGLIEGGCKTIVGQRLKKNSPRWRLSRADHMVALCCLHYSNQWDRFWARSAA